jgi:peptidoglycan/xylan/chitin deacetylase (PgdA/CDA1 family)
MDGVQLGEWVTAAVALAGGAGFPAYAVRGRSSAFFAPSLYRGDSSRSALALTFDDGPSESTPALLEVLSKHGVPATFFMCGENVRRLPHVAREVRGRGHEIGNHTDTHPRFDFKAAEYIYQEMAAAQETIHTATGVTPRLFRAPYGVRLFGLRSAQARLGLTGVMWTVIGRDWRWPAARVAHRLIHHATNGGILCLHDGRSLRPAPDIRATLDAVESALPRLQDRGFKFETVSQMLCLKN